MVGKIKIGKNNNIVVKINLKKFLVSCLIFVIIAGWFFTGWPQIWQSPSVPSEIKRVLAASPATLGATGNEAVLTGWTDAANAHGTTDDDTYATASRIRNDPNISSNYLTYDFDSEIPVGASITKVELLPEWKVDSCAQPAQLIVLAVVSGASQASHSLTCQTTESQSVVDITGDRSWERNDLLDANFKVQVIADVSLVLGKPGVVYTWSLDRVPVRVTYSAANDAPTITALELTPSPITLTDNTTTVATCTVTVNDLQGGNTIDSVTSTVYRSGVSGGSGCSQNDNNCYPNIALFATSSLGTNFYATFTTNLWFHAEPTDNGSYATAQGWDGQTWQCHIITEDKQGDSVSSTDSTPPELNSTAALIITSAIDYGTLAPLASTSLGASPQTTATTTGNVPINVKILGKDMRSYDGYIFGGDQQQYATSDVEWEDPADEGTAVSTSTFAELDLDSGKPTQHNPVEAGATDIIYWKIGIPADQTFATYYSTTTIAATAD